MTLAILVHPLVGILTFADDHYADTFMAAHDAADDIGEMFDLNEIDVLKSRTTIVWPELRDVVSADLPVRPRVPSIDARDVEVRTSEFQMSHGKMPRGRGCWIFEIGGEQFQSDGSATYREALHDAKLIAAASGHTMINLCP